MLQYLHSGFFLPSSVIDHVPHLTHVPLFYVFREYLVSFCCFFESTPPPNGSKHKNCQTGDSFHDDQNQSKWTCEHYAALCCLTLPWWHKQSFEACKSTFFFKDDAHTSSAVNQVRIRTCWDHVQSKKGWPTERKCQSLDSSLPLRCHQDGVCLTSVGYLAWNANPLDSSRPNVWVDICV